MLPKPYRRRRSGIGGNVAATVWRGAPASAVMVGHVDALFAVLGEEGLFECRLATHEVEQLVAGGCLDDRRDRPEHAEPDGVVLDHDVGYAGKAAECRHGDVAAVGEADLDLVVSEVAQGIRPVHPGQLAAAD